MSSMLRPLLVLFALLTVLTGLVYPLAVTGIGKAVFPNQVSGSLVMRDGKAVSHGVDQFTLVREASGWKIAVVAYTSLPIAR